MGNLFRRGTSVEQQEQAIASLVASTSVPTAEVRKLFEDERARLEMTARVRTHLLVLTTSNVRRMLRRAASLRR